MSVPIVSSTKDKKFSLLLLLLLLFLLLLLLVLLLLLLLLALMERNASGQQRKGMGGSVIMELVLESDHLQIGYTTATLL